MKKDKKRKVTISNLSTGKVSVSYIDPNKEPELNKRLSKLMRSLSLAKSKYNPTLFPKLKKINHITQRLDRLNHLAPQLERLNHLNPTPEKLHTLTYWNRTLKPDWINEVLPIFDLSVNDTLEWIRFYSWNTEQITQIVSEYLESEDLESEKLIPSGIARTILIENEKVKATNSILGIICFAAGFYSTDEIKEFLNMIELEPNDNIIKELQRNRQKAQRRKQALDKKIVSLSEKQINRYNEQLKCSLKILRGLGIVGKRIIQTQLTKIKNLRIGI